MKTYEFYAELTLYKPKGLGKGDVPHDDGYSPSIAIPGYPHPFAVRFMDFTGKWNEASKVTLTLYSGIGPGQVDIRPGISFDIIMGKKIVGCGNILSCANEKRE